MQKESAPVNLEKLNKIHSAMGLPDKPEGYVDEEDDFIELEINRECGECNLCCQGWLYAEVFDQVLTYGAPCHYVGCKGCTIYEQRPEDPCSVYECAWLQDGTLPEWLKPSESKLIGTWRKWKLNGELEDYIEIIECGQMIRGKDLQWLLTMSKEQDINIMYMVDGKRYAAGSDEFIKWYEDDFEWL